MKTCTTCKHFHQVIFLSTGSNYDPGDFPNFSESYRRDVCTAVEIINPVNGKKHIIPAAEARLKRGKCGPDGNLWKKDK